MFKVGDIVRNIHELYYRRSMDDPGVVRAAPGGSLLVVTALRDEPYRLRLSVLPMLQDIGWCALQDFEWADEDELVDV